MSSLVSKDRLLTLPLYHGTSSHFWPSIKHYGLGGTNITEDWRLITLLKEALDVLGSVIDDRIEKEMRTRLPILS